MGEFQSIFDDEPEEEDRGALPVEVLDNAEVAKTKEDRRAEELASISDQLLKTHLNIAVDMGRFPEIEPGMTEPPAKWVEEMGEERAKEAFRVANYALLPSKECPAGLKQSNALALGIMRAKAMEKAGNKALNIAVVTMTRPQDPPVPMPEIIIDDTGGETDDY